MFEYKQKKKIETTSKPIEEPQQINTEFKYSNKDQNDFSKGSIISHMLNLSLPMTLAQLVNVAYNIIDRIFIGRIPNNAANALTGLGVAFPICTITIAFANLIGMGGAPLFSIQRGKRNDKEAGAILGNSFIMLILLGVLITITGLLVKRPALYLLGASEATYYYADSYISIYLCGSIFVMLSLGLNSFINAQGFAKTGMLTVSIGAICNLILDPLFIFQAGMGVKGAALATIISQFIAVVWTLTFLTGKKTLIKITVSNFKLKASRIREITGLGLCGFTMAITNSAVSMVCNANLGIYGGDLYIGAMTIINSIREVIQMPVSGITNAAQPVMSFNYGAEKFDRVKATIRYMTSWIMIYTATAWILVLIFSKQCIQIFNNQPELLKVGVSSMHIYFFGFFMMTFQFAGQSTFTALGKAKQAVFFSLLRKAFIVIPLIFLLPHICGLGANGVFLAEPISNFIGGTACFTTMYLTVYKKLGKK